jgi:hypothetical protein
MIVVHLDNIFQLSNRKNKIPGKINGQLIFSDFPPRQWIHGRAACVHKKEPRRRVAARMAGRVLVAMRPRTGIIYRFVHRQTTYSWDSCPTEQTYTKYE